MPRLRRVDQHGRRRAQRVEDALLDLLEDERSSDALERGLREAA